MTMKHPNTLIWVLYIAFTVFLTLFDAFLCLSYKHPSRMPVAVEINYAGDYEGTATLWTSMNGSDLKENEFTCEITDGKAVFTPMRLYSYYTISPNNQLIKMDVRSIEFKLLGHTVHKIDAENFERSRCSVLNIHNTWDNVNSHAKNEDPDYLFHLEPYAEDNNFVLDGSMFPNIYTGCQYVMFILFLIAAGLIFLIQTAMLIFVSKKYADRNRKRSVLLVILAVLSFLFGTICGILSYGTYYVQEHFSDVPIGQIIYHLHTPLNGMGTSSFTVPIIVCSSVAAAMLVVGLILPVIFIKGLKKRFFFIQLIQVGTVIMVTLGSLYLLFDHFEIREYWKYIHSDTTLYDDYFADPNEVELSFPENRRNLIYIYLESMEMTFADTENGGNMAENYIPELTAIAENAYCFSGDTGILNGAHHVNGATFTMGALVAQTGGAPINETLVDNKTLNDTWEEDNNYLPGLTNLGDILATQGYNQEFVIGSDGGFAGRSSYFMGHGDYTIFDYYTAINRGYIPSDYYVWWGYEDYRLFGYAKEEITTLASEDAPFNFTMLTVDTHFTDGWFCEYCENIYPSQYANVLACSSRMVSEFIFWIQEQPFYENTTIVISGDHLTSDAGFIAGTNSQDFNRRTYVAVLNPAPNCVLLNNEYRTYTTLDMFPTTVAALGIEIPGDRLGLGVNLFSDTPTLAEELGYDAFNSELLMNSDYYTNNLLYGQ